MAWKFKTLPLGDDVGDVEITLSAPLTCVCPVNRQPDHATVTVTYAPRGAAVEYSDFRAFLDSFRPLWLSHEAVTQAIALAVQFAATPHWVQVVTRWEPIEGIEVTVRTRLADV